MGLAELQDQALEVNDLPQLLLRFCGTLLAHIKVFSTLASFKSLPTSSVSLPTANLSHPFFKALYFELLLDVLWHYFYYLVCLDYVSVLFM